MSDSSIPALLRRLPGSLRRLVLLLRPDTLLGRIVMTSLLLLGMFALVAGILGQRVSEATGENATALLDRNNVLMLTRDMSNDLWEIEQHLEGYMLTPDQNKQVKMDSYLVHLIDDNTILLRSNWVHRTPSVRIKAEHLQADLLRVKKEIHELMAVRIDPIRAYPAMPTIRGEMSPRAERFLSYTALALEEGKNNLQAPGQIETVHLYYDTLYAWSRVLAAHRAFIAQRFGIFNDAGSGAMKPQADDINLFLGRVETNIEKLRTLEKKKMLLPQQEISLDAMQETNRDWVAGWRTTAAIWNSERWRVDTWMLENSVRPHIAEAWEYIHAIEAEANDHSAADLALFIQLAQGLSGSLWLFLLAGILSGLLLLLILETQIRRPIARVVAALKAETTGITNTPLPASRLAETRELTQAFDRMRQEVHAREDRLRAILDNSVESIITIDDHGVIESFNPAAEHLFGYSAAEVVGQNVKLLMPEPMRSEHDGHLQRYLATGAARILGRERETTGMDKSGRTFPISLKTSEMHVGGRRLFAGMISDISERIQTIEDLRQLAERDGLTGLHNRSYFLGELERVVERARRHGKSDCALLYIDLDQFKYVNDTLGHAAGDKLLIEAAKILRQRVRKSDIVARYGGDEFTVLICDTEPDFVERVADSFRQHLGEYEFRHAGQSVTIGCSIGVALIDGGVTSAAEVFSRADLACHLAKRGGRNRVRLYVADDSRNVENMAVDIGWSRRLRDAIEQNHFQLYAQPIVDAKSRRVVAREILLRLHDEQGQIILPSGFLPAAERFGLSYEVDCWVIEQTIATIAAAHDPAHSIHYAINLSAQSLGMPQICNLIENTLGLYGVDGSLLLFEVTENAAIADLSASALLLNGLRALGCRTALDDFGSGMSSFAYLRELPVDIVKIDGRFIKHLAANDVDQAMVRAMNDIAHALGKQTTAEFVENEDTCRILADIGVDTLQGFHLGRPENFSDVLARGVVVALRQ
ncbi:MAG: EAL domain-containing protein [Gammaproteobacteria bacterium]|nr:EAL domain-containing protein [Gammaproteobacteria bacterium]